MVWCQDGKFQTGMVLIWSLWMGFNVWFSPNSRHSFAGTGIDNGILHWEILEQSYS